MLEFVVAAGVKVAVLGFTDGYGNVEIDPLSRDRLRSTETAFHSTGRQVFVKMSYLLRF